MNVIVFCIVKLFGTADDGIKERGVCFVVSISTISMNIGRHIEL